MLAADSDHHGQQTPTSRLEAVTGLHAEEIGVLKFPIKRGPSGTEFIDGDGRYWDVKTVISPLKSDTWNFDLPAAGNSILKKLNSGQYDIYILLDVSYLKMKHAEDLRRWISDNIPEHLQSKIFEVVVLDGLSSR